MPWIITVVPWLYSYQKWEKMYLSFPPIQLITSQMLLIKNLVKFQPKLKVLIIYLQWKSIPMQELLNYLKNILTTTDVSFFFYSHNRKVLINARCKVSGNEAMRLSKNIMQEIVGGFPGIDEAMSYAEIMK